MGNIAKFWSILLVVTTLMTILWLRDAEAEDPRTRLM